MKYLLSIVFFLASLIFIQQPVNAVIHGKVDVAPAYVRIKVQESGKTVNTLNMAAGRIDATVSLFDSCGICLKPFFQGGSGDHSELLNGGIGLAHYTPINEKLTLIPVVGVAYSQLRTHTNLPQFCLFHLKEKFRSQSTYIGLEGCYAFTPCFYISLIFHYAWARTRTNIAKFPTKKDHSQGPSYAATFDYYMTKNWAINGAVGYNYSLSHEKHGIVAMGAKLGIGYYF